MENSALQLLGGHSPRADRRMAEEDALSQLFRPDKRFEGGYSNALKAAPSLTHELPPPAYNTAEAPRLHKKRSRLLRKDGRAEKPPEYSCSHLIEGELDLKTELSTPFKLAKEHSWSPVYVVLRGPLLSIHRRAPHIITSEAQAGKMLKSYTLQNAEAGLADDCLRVELEPLNARARMVLPRNRWEAYSRDRSMFQKIKYYILRLRVEEEQILLSTYSKTRAMAWLEALCSAMDIAPDIDDRTDPHYFTETRNRARRVAGHLTRNRRLVREQERIFREHYPQFAEDRPEPPSLPLVAGSGPDTNISPRALVDGDGGGDDGDDDEQNDEENENEDDVENEEATAQQQYPDWLNSSNLLPRASRIDALGRRSTDTEARQHTARNADRQLTSLLPPSILYLRQTVHNLASADLDPETQKWRPQHPWTYRHDVLYRRKCLPVLVSNAPRASDIIVKDGKRLKIDWDKKVLIPLDAPLDLGAAEAEEGGGSTTRSTTPLLWRRKQSPDAYPMASCSTGISGNRRAGARLSLEPTSSGSDSNKRSGDEADRPGPNAVSKSVAPYLGPFGLEDNTATAILDNGPSRAKRMFNDLFRSKTNTIGSHNRNTSASSISVQRGENSVIIERLRTLG